MPVATQDFSVQSKIAAFLENAALEPRRVDEFRVAIMQQLGEIGAVGPLKTQMMRTSDNRISLRLKEIYLESVKLFIGDIPGDVKIAPEDFVTHKPGVVYALDMAAYNLDKVLSDMSHMTALERVVARPAGFTAQYGKASIQDVTWKSIGFEGGIKEIATIVRDAFVAAKIGAHAHIEGVEEVPMENPRYQEVMDYKSTVCAINHVAKILPGSAFALEAEKNILPRFKISSYSDYLNAQEPVVYSADAYLSTGQFVAVTPEAT